MNKREARKEASKRCGELEEAYMTEASLKIAERLMDEPVWQKASEVFIYFGVKSEVRTEELIRTALKSGKTVFLPRVISPEEMVFIKTDSVRQTEKGAFGIPEPVYDKERTADHAPDLVIVPCVAVDRGGNRAGHGKGYYDRYLSKVKEAFRICPAYDCQLFDLIETDDNDIGMDMIITESRIIRTGIRK